MPRKGAAGLAVGVSDTAKPGSGPYASKAMADPSCPIMERLFPPATRVVKYWANTIPYSKRKGRTPSNRPALSQGSLYPGPFLDTALTLTFSQQELCQIPCSTKSTAWFWHFAATVKFHDNPAPNEALARDCIFIEPGQIQIALVTAEARFCEQASLPDDARQVETSPDSCGQGFGTLWQCLCAKRSELLYLVTGGLRRARPGSQERQS